MPLPSVGTVPLSTPSHRDEHARLVTAADTDMPQGIIAYRSQGGGPALSTAYVEIAQLPGVPVKTGRLYRFCFMSRAWNNATGAGGYLNLKTPQTPSPVTGTTDLTIDALSYLHANAAYGSVNWQQPFRASANGTITIVIQARSPGGNIYLEGGSMLWVEDIGPDRGRQ
jgi:hypothetical protein